MRPHSFFFHPTDQSSMTRGPSNGWPSSGRTTRQADAVTVREIQTLTARALPGTRPLLRDQKPETRCTGFYGETCLRKGKPPTSEQRPRDTQPESDSNCRVESLLEYSAMLTSYNEAALPKKRIKRRETSWRERLLQEQE